MSPHVGGFDVLEGKMEKVYRPKVTEFAALTLEEWLGASVAHRIRFGKPILSKEELELLVEEWRVAKQRLVKVAEAINDAPEWKPIEVPEGVFDLSAKAPLLDLCKKRRWPGSFHWTGWKFVLFGWIWEPRGSVTAAVLNSPTMSHCLCFYFGPFFLKFWWGFKPHWMEEDEPALVCQYEQRRDGIYCVAINGTPVTPYKITWGTVTIDKDGDFSTLQQRPSTDERLYCDDDNL